MMPLADVRCRVELADRLVEIAHEQTEALGSGDFPAFERLGDERAGLVRAMGEPGLLLRPDEILAVLEQVAEIDRKNIALLGSLIQETSRSIVEIRQGRMVLQRYRGQAGTPVSEASIVDRPV